MAKIPKHLLILKKVGQTSGNFDHILGDVANVHQTSGSFGYLINWDQFNQ